MKKIFYLSTCDTCRRILSQIQDTSKFEMVDIKTRAMTLAEVDEMISLAGSVDAIFSKRARKYRSMGLHERDLSKDEIKNFILEEYTFLKRPVIIADDQIFVGNSKKVVASMLDYLNG